MYESPYQREEKMNKEITKKLLKHEFNLCKIDKDCLYTISQQDLYALLHSVCYARTTCDIDRETGDIKVNLTKNMSARIKFNKQKINKHIPYNEYLQTNHWKGVRVNALKKSGNKCQLCGGKSALHVHHNNYNCLWNETEQDVVVLCSKCHEKFHDKSNKANCQ